MTFAQTLVLENAHVRLEPLSDKHTPELAAGVAEGEIWRTWYTTLPTPEGVAGEISWRLDQQSAGRMAPWAVIDPATGRAVGMTAFYGLDEANRRLMIGHTWLARAAQGTRINAAAKLLLLTRAFESLSCIAVEFQTHFHNRRSRAAIEKLGAKQDGVLRNHRIMPDGHIRDTVSYSVLDAEWPAVRRGLTERLACAG